MMNEGYVTHNYYIEYSPCLLHLIPLNVLKQQIILDGVGKRTALIFSLSADPAQWKRKVWYIFSAYLAYDN